MAIQGTAFFKLQSGGRTYGWSESHWIIGSSGLPNALNKLNRLMQDRTFLLGAGATVEYLRVSQQPVDGTGGVDRDSQISVPEYRTHSALPAAVPAGVSLSAADWTVYNPKLIPEAARIGRAVDVKADFPYSGLMCRAEAQDTKYTTRRAIHILANPDYLQMTSARSPAALTDATAWNKEFADYIKTLCSGDYGVCALDKSDANAPHTVTSWNFAGLQPIVTMVGGAALAVGDKVRISGSEHLLEGNVQIKSLNGIWKIQTKTDNAYTFVSMVTPPNVSGTLKLGKGRKQVHVILPYTKIEMRGFRKKNVGGFFDQPKSRSRRKK